MRQVAHQSKGTVARISSWIQASIYAEDELFYYILVIVGFSCFIYFFTVGYLVVSVFRAPSDRSVALHGRRRS